MSDIIKLLPDNLANQIAAGEVVQRPASVIKELLENAIDAEATEITLIVKDAGKELIQVIDNGKGMTPMDARMCFERHATSKIKAVEDLFAISTMGFRGEAMASISAVAQVELLTQPLEEEIGTQIIIEGGKLMAQNVVACSKGTSIAVKNLFYNVPARRKFLKSNTTETKHILEEFTRVAMAYPAIVFKFIINDTEQFHLRNGSLKNRIIDLLGNRFEKSLIQVNEATDYVTINGFVGKPEAATKSRGNQFFFINNRFIKNPYLHHAVANAFRDLIEKDANPFYVLFFEIDPKRIDVNVHPTKQEIKFEDDQILYSYVMAAVKHALARFNIAPSLDFSLDEATQSLESLNIPANNRDITKAASGYLSGSFSKGNAAHFIEKDNSGTQWSLEKEHFFDKPLNIPTIENEEQEQQGLFEEKEMNLGAKFMQWNEFLITITHQNLMLIHIKRAQQRITYDRLERMYMEQSASSQQLLFPEMIELNMTDNNLLLEIREELNRLGFDISEMGNQTVAIQGLPMGVAVAESKTIIEDIIAQAHYDNSQMKKDFWKKIAQITSQKSIGNWSFSEANAQELIGQLFASQQPTYTSSGALIVHSIKRDEMTQIFKMFDNKNSSKN